MSKPTWRPEIPADLREQGFHLCHCCGWRTTRTPFCDACERAAHEAPPQSIRPTPIKVPGTDAPRVRRRGFTAAEEAYVHSILPITCKRCGAGGHVSADCPEGAA